MEVIMFIGIPASGKSTFYQENFRDTHVRINRDMLRTKNRVARHLDLCLEIEQPCVLDNTNLLRAERVALIAHIKERGASCVGYYFQTDLKRSLARNQDRRLKERLPDVAVLGQHARLEIPELAEGFDRLFYVGTDDDRFTVSPMNS